MLVLISNYAQFLVTRRMASPPPPSCAPAPPRGFSLPRDDAPPSSSPSSVAAAAGPPPAAPPRGAPLPTSELAAFCTPPEPGAGALPAAVAAAQWDLVSLWPAAQMRELLAHPCFLTTLNQQKDLGFLPVYICTHDPALDQVMAAAFHSYNWWGANNDHRFMLAAGYAGGTPLRAHEAGAMRDAAARARAAGAPLAGGAAALAAALKLPAIAPADLVRSSCSRERPFVLDIGGNIGYYTLVAAATGCSVVTVEPLAANIGRLWQSVLANRFEGQVSLFKNAVGKDKRLVTLSLNRGNPGASFVSDKDAALPGGAGGVAGGGGAHAGGDAETVATVLLDELFDGAPHRPRHPFTGAPIAPEDVAIVKVDVEGFDAAALWALRGAIEAGRPPLIKVEYEAGGVKGTSGCDNVELIRWLYDLGYLGCALGGGALLFARQTLPCPPFFFSQTPTPPLPTQTPLATASPSAWKCGRTTSSRCCSRASRASCTKSTRCPSCGSCTWCTRTRPCPR